MNNEQSCRIEKIRLREKLAYGLGDVASNIVWTAISAFITYYYTDAIGIAAATAGTIFLLSRIFDGLSDILMGIIVDKTKTKHGKARPWLLWMAVPFFISTVLLFAVPNFSITGKIIWAFITYNIMTTVVYTAINLPYGVMNVLITDDPKDRVSLNIFRMVGAMLMGIIINVIVMPLVNAVGGELGSMNPMAWTIVMGAFGFISMIVFFICFKGTKERVKPVDKNPVPVKKALPLLLKNKFWYIVLLVNLLGQITTGLTGVNVYFAKYWLGDENMVGMLSIVMMIPMVIGLFAASPFISKFGKRNCITVGSVIGAVGMVSIILNPASFIFVMVGMFIKGLGMGVNSAATMILIADVIDYGEWKNGVRSDGIAYSAQSFGAKLGAGLGAAALGWGLAWGSYNADLAIQNVGAMNAILIIFAVVPLIINVLTIVLLSFYSLDKKLPQIRKELEERRALAVSTEQA